MESFSDSETAGSGGELVGGGSGLMPDLDDVPGYSPAYLASLSEEERQMLLAGLQESGTLDPDARDSRSAASIAASSRRSGSASNGD